MDEWKKRRKKGRKKEMGQGREVLGGGKEGEKMVVFERRGNWNNGRIDGLKDKKRNHWMSSWANLA